MAGFPAVTYLALVVTVIWLGREVSNARRLRVLELTSAQNVELADRVRRYERLARIALRQRDEARAELASKESGADALKRLGKG